MNKHGLSRSSQRGVALVVALLILVMISILGISAMRTSIFNAKIAVGAQVGTMTFQAAESAIAAMYEEAMSDIKQPGHVIAMALTQKSAGLIQIQDRCVTRADVSKPGLCAAGDFLIPAICSRQSPAPLCATTFPVWPASKLAAGGSTSLSP